MTLFKKDILYLILTAVILLSIMIFVGCKDDDEKKDAEPESTPAEELLIGSWNRYNNKIYTLLILRANGNWTSDLRIEGASSKIVERKGNAEGTWKLEENNLILTVFTSKLENVWEANKTYIFEIIELNKQIMTLKYPNSRIITWKRSRIQKTTADSTAITPSFDMKPIVVNLNKHSSHEKDRYLCLALTLHIDNTDPDKIPPAIHPNAWEASIIFLSSLVYKDVKTFDEMKIVKNKLTTILNPYLNGILEEIDINHVMISSNKEKVDEFIIEHSPAPDIEETAPEEGKT